MSLSRHRHCRHRVWLAAFGVPLRLLRALVPTGYMPEAGTDGWVALQLCTTQGLERRRVQVDPRLDRPCARNQRVALLHPSAD